VPRFASHPTTESADAPPELHAWFSMAVDVAAQTGFPGGLDMTALTKACVARNEAVQAAIPARQLLVYQVKEAWEPLCAFLEVPDPDGPVSAH
jgi:Sulfotransferase domain